MNLHRSESPNAMSLNTPLLINFLIHIGMEAQRLTV